MFYSKYSDYSAEQIITEKYEKLCVQLINIVKDEQIKEKMKRILYEGGYDNFSVNSEMTRNNEQIERKRRVEYAYLLATNSETFEIITKNNIDLFHGTNVNELPSILKYGMNSVDELAKKAIIPSSGEKWSRIGGKRSFISFTDDLGIAVDYATINNSEIDKKDTSFGVMLGISSNDIGNLKTCHVQSCLPEIGIEDNVPLEYIKFVAVPESKVEFVRKLINDDRIIVAPIDMEQRFYYVDLDSLDIICDEQKANELIQGKKTHENTTVFDNKDVNKLARGRIMTGILDLLKGAKEKVNNRGKSNYENSR